jgi:hypothetical protein
MQKLIIEFSLVKESNKKKKDEILREISEVFSSEKIVIPWCNNIKKISLK